MKKLLLIAILLFALPVYAKDFAIENDTATLLNVTGAGNIFLVPSGGLVGIGTTIMSQLLTVGGNANITGTLYATSFFGNGENLTGINAASTNISILYGVNASNSSQVLPARVSTEGNLMFSVQEGTGTGWTRVSGNIYPSTITDSVGIGTASPNQLLHISGGNLNISSGNAFITGALVVNGTTITGGGSTSLSAANITAGTFGSGLFTFPNGLNITQGGLNVVAGNVGIGTTAPDALLRVNGVAKVTSLVVVDGLGKIVGSTTGNGVGLDFSGDTVSFGYGSGSMVKWIGGNPGSFDLQTYNTPIVMGTGSTAVLKWGSDTGLSRNAAGVVEINSGTAGTYRDLQLRAINPTTGNVGIGTTSPSSMLQVTGNVSLATTSGNVGIGTASPRKTLNVAGTSQFEGTMSINGTKTISFLRCGGTSNCASNAGDNTYIQRPQDEILYIASVNGTQFRVSDSETDAMKISSTGNVGIGTTNPAYALDVLTAVNNNYYGLRVKGGANSVARYNAFFDSDGAGTIMYLRGDLYPWVNQAWGVGSDRRLKENISYISDSGLDKILQLKPARFDYISGTKNNLGFIAQDVQEVIPEAISVQENGMLSLKSDFIIPYTVNAIQELDSRTKGIETSQQGDVTISGNVGIGDTSPGYTLTVSGTAWVTSGAWSGSDIKWKQNITSLQNSLDKVMQLRPVSFLWRNVTNMTFPNGTQIGFIAQDVEKVIPELVTTDNNGYKGISYERITPVLTGAIQELKKENDVLKAKNNELERRIAALEAAKDGK